MEGRAQSRVGRGKEPFLPQEPDLSVSGSIPLCGGLVLSSFLLTAVNQEFLKSQLNLHFLPAWMAFAMFKLAAIPITILALFLIYWLLPNVARSHRRVVARTAIVIGLESN